MLRLLQAMRARRKAEARRVQEMQAEIRRIFSSHFVSNISPRRQVAQIRRWNRDRSWGFTSADFKQLPPPPKVGIDARKVLVLTPFLATPQETAAELWAVAAGRQKNAWKLDELRFDVDHLRLLPGAVHEPGLRWVVINPLAHRHEDWRLQPRNVRSVQFSAGPEILAAAAHRPDWVQLTQQGGYAPLLVLGGYQARETPDVPWDDAPILFYSELQELLALNLFSASEQRSEISVPVITAS